MRSPEHGSPDPETPDPDRPPARLDPIDVEFAKYFTGPSMGAQEHLRALDSPNLTSRLREWHLAQLAESSDPILSAKLYEIYRTPRSPTEQAIALMGMANVDKSVALSTIVGEISQFSPLLLIAAYKILEREKESLQEEQIKSLRSQLEQDLEAQIFPEARIQVLLLGLSAAKGTVEIYPSIAKVIQRSNLSETIETAAVVVNTWPIPKVATLFSEKILERKGDWEQNKVLQLCLELDSKQQDHLIALLRAEIRFKQGAADLDSAFEFIAQSNSSRAVPALKALLGETNAEIREYAANALINRYMLAEDVQSQRKISSSIAALIPKSDSLTQDGALRVLEGLMSGGSYLPLLRFIKRAQEPLRSRIADILITIKEELPAKSFNLALELLTDPQPDLQLIALQILKDDSKYDLKSRRWKQQRKRIIEYLSKFLSTQKSVELVCEASRVFAALDLREGLPVLKQLFESNDEKKEVFVHEVIGSAIQRLSPGGRRRPKAEE